VTSANHGGGRRVESGTRCVPVGERGDPGARGRCRESLRAGRSFACNATNLLRQTRRRWIDLFADYDARIEIVYIEPPLAVILDRNRRCERPVPEKVIRALADKCEPPTLTEAHGLTIVCEDEGAGLQEPRKGEARP
jgi:hypothetical protein